MKKIIIVGKAGAGKNFFKEFLLTKGYQMAISHTTRPMRGGEVQQEDYYFISRDLFEVSIKNNMFFEHKEYDGDIYGTSNRQMKKGNIFLFNPKKVLELPYNFKKHCVVVYLDIDKETRLERLKKRVNAKDINQRIAADEIEFDGFKGWDIRVAGETIDCEYTLKKILSYE